MKCPRNKSLFRTIIVHNRIAHLSYQTFINVQPDWININQNLTKDRQEGIVLDRKSMLFLLRMWRTVEGNKKHVSLCPECGQPVVIKARKVRENEDSHVCPECGGERGMTNDCPTCNG